MALTGKVTPFVKISDVPVFSLELFQSGKVMISLYTNVDTLYLRHCTALWCT